MGVWVLVGGCVCRVEKNHDFLFRWDFFYLFDFFKSGIHNVIKYLTIKLSGINTATQVCALCAFVLKNPTLFYLDACKQLFVLNSYKSAIKKIGSKKNHKSMIFFGVI